MNQYGTSSLVLSVVSGIVIIYALASLGAPTGKERKIQLLHAFAGVFHILSALTLGWLADSEPAVWEAPTYTIVSIWQNTTVGGCSDDGKCFLNTRVIRGKNIPIAICAVLFGIISGYAHLLAAVIVGPQKLTEYAETGTNWTRWADYTLSASLMIVVIACLSGVLDSYVLSTISLCQAFMLLGAYFIESDLASAYIQNTPTRSRGLLWLAISCFFYLPCVWGPVVGSFYQSLHNAPTDVPEWINAMIWILFTLFSSFIGIMVYYLAYLGRTPNVSNDVKRYNMVLQELGYVCLSLTSKITLHWVLFVGITARSGVLFNTAEEALDPSIYHRTGEDSSKTTSNVLIAAAASIAFGIIFYIGFRKYILKEYRTTTQETLKYSFIG